MYNAEIRYNAYGDNDSLWEKEFTTLQDAVDWLKQMAGGVMICAARINNKIVRVVAGSVRDLNGEEVCTNEKWHEIFAPYNEQIIPKKKFVPRSGRISQNPATLIECGEDI